MVLFLQALNIFAVLFIVAVLLWRVLANSGVPLKKAIIEPVYESYTPDLKDSAKIFSYSLLFRAFILIASISVFCLFETQEQTFQWGKWLNKWVQWDARHYISISNGYESYIENGEYPTLVFFPLYSFILNIVNYIIPSAELSGLLVSALFSSIACCYFYKLVCLDYGKETADLSVILLCIFPFGFFYSAIMSESVFLATSVMTLYYIRKHNWVLAGIAGCFVALSRSVGVFLVFPAAIALLEETQLLGNIKDSKIWVNALKKGIWLLLLPIGTLIYLFINYKITGEPLYFLSMEEQFWHQVGTPFYKIWNTYISVFDGGYSLSVLMASFIPSLICLLCAYGLLIVGLKKHKTMYLCWLLICVLVNTSISWPLSLCRYLASCVPIYIILADECKKRPKLKIALIIGFSILMGIYFTGYLNTKSIM